MSSLDIPYLLATTQHPLVEAYATRLGLALKRASAVVVNGCPLIPQPPQNDCRLEFQKKWLQTPQSQHQLTYYNCHIIPGTGSVVVSAGGKVKFDESGRTRLGESADLIPDDSTTPARPIWGLWLGFTMSLTVDESSILSQSKDEAINSLDYRFTYVPEDVVLLI